MKPWAKAQIEAALGADPTRTREVKRVQRTAHGPEQTRCASCGRNIPTAAAQTRHLRETGHARYEINLA